MCAPAWPTLSAAALIAALIAILVAACTTTPLAPIPQPLPVTLAWASQADPAGGAFLGLKGRENLVGGFDDLDFQAGLRVTHVVENSPAAKAGCRVGDVLLAFDGHRTNDPGELEALVVANRPGNRIVLEVQRGDTVFEVPVELEAPAGAEALAPQDSALATHRLDPARSRGAWRTGMGGAVLVASADRAPFPRAGIPVGSVVRAIDGEEVLSDRALIRCLEGRAPGAVVEARFLGPDGEERSARVTLQDQPTKVTRISLPVLFTYDADVEGQATSFVLLDLWFLSLFRYERSGEERRWRFLRFFEFSTGVGELSE